VRKTRVMEEIMYIFIELTRLYHRDLGVNCQGYPLPGFPTFKKE